MIRDNFIFKNIEDFQARNPLYGTLTKRGNEIIYKQSSKDPGNFQQYADIFYQDKNTQTATRALGAWETALTYGWQVKDNISFDINKPDKLNTGLFTKCPELKQDFEQDGILNFADYHCLNY